MIRPPYQWSMLDSPDLIGSAVFEIDVSPKEIAESFGMQVEVSFDQLYYFDFLALKTDHGIFGFRRYNNDNAKYSYLSIQHIAEEEIEKGLKELLPSFNYQLFKRKFPG